MISSSASGNPSPKSARVSSTWSRQTTLVILRLTLDPWRLFVQDDTCWEQFQETWRRTGSRGFMASTDRCRHKIAQRFFSIPFFRVGVPLGCRPPVIRWWECLRSRDGSKGVVLVGTSRTQVEGQGATRLAVDDLKLSSGLAFQPRGLGRRTSASQSRGQFEGCVTESLQTITAVLFWFCG